MAGKSNNKIPKPRNPVASTLRDPRCGFTQRTIPDKRQPVLPRKRKHKGRYDSN